MVGSRTSVGSFSKSLAYWVIFPIATNSFSSVAKARIAAIAISSYRIDGSQLEICKDASLTEILASDLRREFIFLLICKHAPPHL
jgi:hypothetical protein